MVFQTFVEDGEVKDLVLMMGMLKLIFRVIIFKHFGNWGHQAICCYSSDEKLHFWESSD